MVLVGSFYGDNIGGLFDHADGARVARGIQTDRAQVLFGQIEALAAEADCLLDLDERMSQRQRLLGRNFQQMEGQALGSLWTHPRKLRQLIDEFLDGGTEHESLRGRAPN